MSPVQPVRCDFENWSIKDPPILVGIQTWNPLSTLRLELLTETVESAAFAFPDSRITIFDNGSTDGSWEAIRSLFREAFSPQLCIYRRQGADNTTPGAGRNALLRHLLEDAGGNHAIIVMSDDDMQWLSGADNALRSMWQRAHPQLAVLGGLLEPIYEWNTPRFTLEAVGAQGWVNETWFRHRALVRDTTPGAAFSLYTHSPFWKSRRYQGAVWFEERFGYDVAFSREVWEQGHWVAQMDLAEHIGWEASTHGNRAIGDSKTRPLELVKWGLTHE